MHLNSQLLFEKYCRSYFNSGSKVLEIGPNDSPSYFEELVSDSTIEWHTLDIGTEHIGNAPNNPKFILSSEPYQYPIADNIYDIVFADQVIGHVNETWTWIGELKRIIKPGGFIILTASVSWPNCFAPIDCWRVYPEGIKTLFAYNNLLPVVCEFESLELEHFGYSSKLKKIPNFTVPDVSVALGNKMIWSNKVKIEINRFLQFIPGVRRFMNPVRIAYDTVGIAHKIY
jgi:SAM-dependent methyltransferase